MILERMAAQNPWWQDPQAILADKHVQDFMRSPIQWHPKVAEGFILNEDLVYTLRGPRQVGKTTLLKLLIKRSLEEGIEPKDLLYLDCELAGITKPQELADFIITYLDWSSKGKRKALFLDEVTYVKDWAISLKGLIDAGKLSNVAVIATGSHAVDLKRGGERMPGRRGARAGLDKRLFPMSFREYVQTLNPKLSKLPHLRDLSQQSLKGAAEELALFGDALRTLFDRYLLAGGFPRPAAAEVAFGHIPPYVYDVYRDAILGDLAKLGRRETYFRELATWILRRIGDPFDWRDVARETDIGKHDTVREYVEDLELAFLWDVVYRVKTLGEPQAAFRSGKKVYLKDPFIFHTLSAWTYGLLDPWQESLRNMADPEKKSRLVEGAVAAHLRRLWGNFIYYFRDQREIDFVVYERGKLEALIEVKYQDRIFPEDWKALERSGGGLLLSKSALDFFGSESQPQISVLPAAYFLALIP